MPAPQATRPHLATGPSAAHFVVGQDEQGHWLALDTARPCGGLFKSRADAIHFASFETGHRPDGVEFATAPLRLLFRP